MKVAYNSNGNLVIQEFETAPGFEHIEVTKFPLLLYATPLS